MQQSEQWRLPHRAALLENAHAHPRVVLYVTDAATSAQCVTAARSASVAVIEVKHLQAACAALALGPAPMLVVSRSVKWWDRTVIEEHAARAAAPIRWVSEGDLDTLERDISAWSIATLRPRRPEVRRTATLARPRGR